MEVFGDDLVVVGSGLGVTEGSWESGGGMI